MTRMDRGLQQSDPRSNEKNDGIKLSGHLSVVRLPEKETEISLKKGESLGKGKRDG